MALGKGLEPLYPESKSGALTVVLTEQLLNHLLNHLIYFLILFNLFLTNLKS